MTTLLCVFLALAAKKYAYLAPIIASMLLKIIAIFTFLEMSLHSALANLCGAVHEGELVTVSVCLTFS